jgi:EAL domain-containing protein (putative c-di-GMP-specific phosphodiesterase class I)
VRWVTERRLGVDRRKRRLARAAKRPNYEKMTPDKRSCEACHDGLTLPFDFSMAFQPIVDIERGSVFAYEALARGPGGEPAFTVLEQVTAENRYAFDQACRVKAIVLAAKLGLPSKGASLSINIMPGAVYNPASCIQLTLKTAAEVGFPTERLIFEFVESEEVRDRAHLRGIIEHYRARKFKIAIDDFGAGFSGLNLLADLPTDIVKLDMELIRNVHERPAARAIVSLMTELAATLGSEIVAEGVETVEEFQTLRDCGVRLMQGFLFARPAFQALPPIVMPFSETGAIAS